MEQTAPVGAKTPRIVDVVRAREGHRQRRLRRVAFVLAPLVAWLWWRIAHGNPAQAGVPELPADAIIWMPAIIFFALLGAIIILPMLAAGRSPHVTYLPEQIEISFDDVRGLTPVLREVRHSLDVFLNHIRFRDELGGKPRRGILYEGPPGTGKTHMAKAMAREAGVPFLFVSATAFQSMWYGATARKIRAYFRELRKVARKEGGAIGFIEEIDAIATARSGVSSATPLRANTAWFGSGLRVERAGISEATGGVVNELLIQMQSFDEPTRGSKTYNAFIRSVNRYLPPNRQLASRVPPFANVMLVAATNRADKLDPALMRPGRFDRVLHFGLPARKDRRDLIDYFAERRAHADEFDSERRDSLAAITMGATPATLERLLDEALLLALRDGRDAFTYADIRQAQMDTEIGLASPVDYPEKERIAIPTHEAGHATVAHLVGVDRRLEMLSIVKRANALGMLAHRDEYERYTRTAGELRSLIMIAFGGMAAEELMFGEAGTGPAADLTAATRIAVEMVGAYGMGDSYVAYSTMEEMLAGNLAAKVLADPKGRRAVDRILDDAKAATSDLLKDHRHLVSSLRNALLDREELSEAEIAAVIVAAEHNTRDEEIDDHVLVDLRAIQQRLGR